jgi:hypothetical protein
MTEKKKILLVSDGFYPEISPRSFRATELAKEFCRNGHDVTIISRFRDHDYSDFQKEFPVTLKMLNKPVFPKIPALKQKFLSFMSRGISRILSLLFEYPGIEEMFSVGRKLKTENGYNLMISFAVPYPVHWGVAWSRSKKHGIAEIWVADCGDPYMGCQTDSFRKVFYFKYIEKWFCGKTDFITIPHELARNGYYSEFHYKIKIIPQGFEFDLSKERKTMPLNEPLTFAYAGAFINGIRDPREFLDYLCSVKQDFRFLIFTRQKDMLESYLERLQGKLEILDFIPRQTLIEKLSDMDFLINFDNNTDVQLPSKLIDYAITERPVLNIKKGFDRDDALAFINRNYSKKMILPDIRQYHISIIAQKFIELVPN